jgi:hypothetical protein
MNAEQIKAEIRYVSRSDQVQIYRWLVGEVAGDTHFRIGLNRSLAIRQDIEQKHKANFRTERASDRPGAMI